MSQSLDSAVVAVRCGCYTCGLFNSHENASSSGFDEKTDVGRFLKKKKKQKHVKGQCLIFFFFSFLKIKAVFTRRVLMLNSDFLHRCSFVCLFGFSNVIFI